MTRGVLVDSKGQCPRHKQAERIIQSIEERDYEL
jgi:hypothetical protein